MSNQINKVIRPKITMGVKKYISEGEGLPNWENPISHAVTVNNMCFVSGQLSMNCEGKYVPGSVLEEAKLAFKNFFAAFKAAGFHKDDIVTMDMAILDIAKLAEINQLYTELFPSYKRPARTVYQVEALPYGGKIKISGTAVRNIDQIN